MCLSVLVDFGNEMSPYNFGFLLKQTMPTKSLSLVVVFLISKRPGGLLKADFAFKSSNQNNLNKNFTGAFCPCNPNHNLFVFREYVFEHILNANK